MSPSDRHDQLSFVFSIPLIPRARANDWNKVVLNLSLTLQSLQNQTDPDWMAVICGHETPDVPELNDPRIHALQTPQLPVESIAQGSTDKYRKRRHIASWLKQNDYCNVMIFGLDADDWVHYEFVRTCKRLTRSGIKGLLINAGYRVDFLSGRGEIISQNFFKGCGSCFVGQFGCEDLPESHADRKASYSQIACGHHARQGERAEKLGFSVGAVDWPCIAYTINHSESLRGLKTGGRIRSLMRHREQLSRKFMGKIIRDEFGVLPPVLERSRLMRSLHFVRYSSTVLFKRAIRVMKRIS
ncbi:glycosyltransferase [Wenzhouxiangella limi]|uniref:Glycosyltransferase 2-like domain-containing protein n=1 Tax=Wenzhouxiangella limi TaxID=2707351 RepID=A0A845UTY9_9GAMM|nr:glycosyltransferase [Wenzhouxiangella limi]NDY95293.1 hypothetical protein [Wenzhouxiangella limi]